LRTPNKKKTGHRDHRGHSVKTVSFSPLCAL
jgi:hypothetical protein